MRTIMCAVDESRGAAEALEVALGLSRGLGLRLVLAHVVEGHRRTNGFQIDGPEAGRAGAQLLERIARKHNLEPTDRRVEVGDRPSELSRDASEAAAAVVIIAGARGRYRRGRGRLSRLSAELSSTAPCPVGVVSPHWCR